MAIPEFSLRQLLEAGVHFGQSEHQLLIIDAMKILGLPFFFLIRFNLNEARELLLNRRT